MNNWYRYAKLIDELEKEAGWKENIQYGLMGAVVMVFLGSGLMNAAKQMNISEEEIATALQNKSITDQAKQIASQIEPGNMSPVHPEQSPEIPSVSPDTFIQEAYEYIGDNEGEKFEVYRDHKGNPTIGVGHLILDGEDFSKGITREQSQALFAKDVQKHLNRAKGLFPNFDSYPNYIKVALLDGVYRGEHEERFKTTQLINEGKWIEASKEYIDRDDYDESKAQGKKHGVWQRMDRNAKRMAQYGKELGN